MKNNFDPARKGWDRFHAFHTWDGGFTSFETGEVRIDRYRFEPNERKYYEKYDVTLTATSDQTNIIYLHPFTGKQIPKAQLAFKGLQYLVVDHRTKKAVALNSTQRANYKELPNHIVGANVWSYNNESEIHSNGKIDVNAPSVITPEMIAWKNTVEVIVKMRGTAITKGQYYYRYGKQKAYPLSITKMAPYDFVEQCLNKETGGNHHQQLFHDLKTYGVEFTRDPEPLDYLMVDFKK
jgi:hypothetical protein